MTKNVLIVLRADDEGEGGKFAMYTLLALFSHMIKHDPVNSLVKMERSETYELAPSNRGFRIWLEWSMHMRALSAPHVSNEDRLQLLGQACGMYND